MIQFFKIEGQLLSFNKLQRIFIQDEVDPYEEIVHKKGVRFSFDTLSFYVIPADRELFMSLLFARINVYDSSIIDIDKLIDRVSKENH